MSASRMTFSSFLFFIFFISDTSQRNKVNNELFHLKDALHLQCILSIIWNRRSQNDWTGIAVFFIFSSSVARKLFFLNMNTCLVWRLLKHKYPSSLSFLCFANYLFWSLYFLFMFFYILSSLNHFACCPFFPSLGYIIFFHLVRCRTV